MLEETSELPWALYIKCSCILILKMHLLSWNTGRARVKEQVIHSEEDRMWMKPDRKIALSVDGNGHPSIERIRDLHEYDLGTVLPFVIILPMWFSTLPSASLADWLIYSFGICNIGHSLVSLRGFSYCKWLLSFCALAILGYMHLATIVHYV